MVIVNSATGITSFTNGGTTTGYYTPGGIFSAVGISTSSNQASFTTVYASGNVGIGTSSPGSRLDVAGGDIALGSSYSLTWANGGNAASDRGLNFGFGSQITRRASDGHMNTNPKRAFTNSPATSVSRPRRPSPNSMSTAPSRPPTPSRSATIASAARQASREHSATTAVPSSIATAPAGTRSWRAAAGSLAWLRHGGGLLVRRLWPHLQSRRLLLERDQQQAGSWHQHAAGASGRHAERSRLRREECPENDFPFRHLPTALALDFSYEDAASGGAKVASPLNANCVGQELAFYTAGNYSNGLCRSDAHQHGG